MSYCRRLLCCFLLLPAAGCGQSRTPVMAHKGKPAATIAEIPLPEGYIRQGLDKDSFGAYLRSLSLKQENNTVYLYNGKPKARQDVHEAVLTIDVGTKDLQQCADAVMRLRAEYLYGLKRYDDIHFNFLSDNKPRYYKDHADAARSRKSFRKYMDYIFSYANTASLLKELKKIDIGELQPGDVFIQQGNPYGHAVIVIDVAVHTKTKKKIFLLAQSYMPAQEIHILKNFNNENLSSWYEADIADLLETPEWTFYKGDLRRF